MKIVLIAGPYYSGGDPEKIEYNIRHAEKYAIALANRNIGFFCPHLHTSHFEAKANAPEEFYKELDMVIYDRACDGVVLIPGWENSSGARNEERRATERGIPKFFPKSPDDEECLAEIEHWAKK